MKKNVTIAASILTANFLKLKDDLSSLQTAGINWIHFDVMDNHFVPNLTFGPKILQDICNFNTKINIDCHMMVKINTSTIKHYLEQFLFLPQVKNITLHYEALTSDQLTEFLEWENPGFKKGLAINPETTVASIINYLSSLDTILIMSVKPGAGGQSFLDATISKIEELVTITAEKFPHLTIAVDGGINDKTAKQCVTAGANYLVVGSFLLNSNNNNNIKNQLEKLLTYEKH